MNVPGLKTGHHLVRVLSKRNCGKFCRVPHPKCLTYQLFNEDNLDRMSDRGDREPGEAPLIQRHCERPDCKRRDPRNDAYFRGKMHSLCEWAMGSLFDNHNLLFDGLTSSDYAKNINTGRKLTEIHFPVISSHVNQHFFLQDHVSIHVGDAVIDCSPRIR